MKQSSTIPSLCSSDTEYILYTFEVSHTDRQTLSWKKKSITHNRLSALSAGQKLFNQGLYSRIELYHRTKDGTSPYQPLKPIHSWSSRAFKKQTLSNLVPFILLFMAGCSLLIALALSIFIHL